MYICEYCGNSVDEIPTITYYDRVDGNSAMSGYITETENCSCGGNYVEAKECACCGEYISTKGKDICDKCITKNMNIQTTIAYSDEYVTPTEIEINSFIASIFDKKQINSILIKAMTEMIDSGDCNIKDFEDKAKNFCNEDRNNFYEYLMEHVEDL